MNFPHDGNDLGIVGDDYGLIGVVPTPVIAVTWNIPRTGYRDNPEGDCHTLSAVVCFKFSAVHLIFEM